MAYHELYLLHFGQNDHSHIQTCHHECITDMIIIITTIVKTPTSTQHNTTVGFDMKMTVQTTTYEQLQQYEPQRQH